MATMTTGLGGASGYGENSVKTLGVDSGNLDDGAVNVDITSVFGAGGIDFYGTSYTSIYINTNGVLTFDGPELNYMVSGIEGYGSPAIAPFWGDIDITKGGDIYWDIDPTAGTVTITWLDVARYDGSGTNSFQVVLTDNGAGDFAVEFIYEDIQWMYGNESVSGGGSTAGITDGGANDIVLDGAFDEAVMLTYPTKDFGYGDPGGTFAMNVQGGEPVACFAAGTLIETLRGPVPVERVCVGDLLRTRDHGLQPVLWVGSTKVRRLDGCDRAHLRPVVIPKNALGNARALRVSRQHAFLILDKLVRAGHLAEHFGGQVARTDRKLKQVTYHHVLMAQHTLVMAEGIWTESMYPGPYIMGMLGASARTRIIEACPQAASTHAYGPPAYPYMRRADLSGGLRMLAQAPAEMAG